MDSDHEHEGLELDTVENFPEKKKRRRGGGRKKKSRGVTGFEGVMLLASSILYHGS